MVFKKKIARLLILTVMSLLVGIVCPFKGWSIQPHPILELISKASQDGSEGFELLDKTCSAKKWKTLLLFAETIEDELAVYIANFLSKSKSFTALVLNNNELSPQGMSHILGAIKKNNYLEHIRIISSHIGDEGLNNISELLKRNTHLKELMISGVGPLSSTAMEHFAQALMNNHTLEELTFEFLATPLFPVLLKGLKDNKSIKRITIDSISVCSREINDYSINLLSSLLRTHQHIEEIYVAGQHIGDGNLEDFMSALAKNKTLKKLELHVTLSPQDIIYLSDALKENTTLETLSFRSSLTENNDCLKALANGLSNNQGLRSLDISGTMSGTGELRVEWEKLRELATRNNNRLIIEF